MKVQELQEFSNKRGLNIKFPEFPEISNSSENKIHGDTFCDHYKHKWCTVKWDSRGNVIFWMDSTGYWIKSKYDSDSNLMFRINSKVE